MKDNKENMILNNGVKMPALGLGTYQIQDRDKLSMVIREGIEIGYRHIDTASFYGNEKIIGEAIRESGIPRNEIFLADKVWNDDQGYEQTLKAFNESVKKLKAEYLDLYLIHWPQPLSKETWRAFEKLYKEDYVRAIGVSNFTVSHLENLIKHAEVMPAVNQIEFHPGLVQEELMAFCGKHSIQTEAWSPLMRGAAFGLPLLQELAKKYERTVAQIVLRWDLQMGVSTIPRSTSQARLEENTGIFDFEIMREDMIRIKELNKGMRIGTDPDKVYEHPDLIKD